LRTDAAFCKKIINFRCFTPVRRPSCRWQYGSTFIEIFLLGSKRYIFSAIKCVSTIQGTNRKRVWYFCWSVIVTMQGPIISDYAATFWLKIANFSYPTLVWCPSSDVLFGTLWWSLPRRN